MLTIPIYVSDLDRYGMSQNKTDAKANKLDFDFDLNIGDCTMLQTHYANVMGDTTLLVQLAGQRQKSVLETFHECKKAMIILGNRIKYLKSKGKTE